MKRPMSKTPAQLDAEIAAALAKREGREKGKPWLRDRRLLREKARDISDDQLRELRAWAEALSRQTGGYSKGLSIAREATVALGELTAPSGDSREHARARCADIYQREMGKRPRDKKAIENVRATFDGAAATLLDRFVVDGIEVPSVDYGDDRSLLVAIGFVADLIDPRSSDPIVRQFVREYAALVDRGSMPRKFR
jgi:hypothetical protein